MAHEAAASPAHRASRGQSASSAPTPQRSPLEPSGPGTALVRGGFEKRSRTRWLPWRYSKDAFT